MRIVCISDTHGLHDKITLPPGDVLIHAGDFTKNGTGDQVAEFADWIEPQPFANKLVVAGNHDWLCQTHPSIARDLLDVNNVTYLLDQPATIDGVIFYGSPWQPAFCNWAFNVARGQELRKKWDLIPNGVNVLITHGPPFGMLDRTERGVSAGCEELADVIAKSLTRLNLCVFGHIHEGYGYFRQTSHRRSTPSGSCLFVNASTCNLQYKPVNPPIVLDYVDGRVEVVIEDREAVG